MKQSASRWIDRSVRADLIVMVGQNAGGNIDQPLPEAVGDELTKVPGIDFVDPSRMTQQTFHGRPFKLAANELEDYQRYNTIPVVAGDLTVAMRAIKEGTALAASQAFTRDFGVKLGDKIELQTAHGPRTFEIALVYVDFNSDLGILTTTRSVYKRLWNDSLVDTFSVYLHPGAAGDSVREKITQRLAGRYRLLVANNEEYRAGAMDYIDSSFALMRATEIVAIIVAVLGIINTLLVSVMDRRTEIGVLKAIGADAKQIQQMLLTEGSLIGLSASIVGVCFGALFSAYIVRELLRFQIGWELSWQLSGWVILETFVLGQLVCAFAVWWPVRTARRVAPAEALQYE
jgi:putative ABC transport system permease protein